MSKSNRIKLKKLLKDMNFILHKEDGEYLVLVKGDGYNLLGCTFDSKREVVDSLTKYREIIEPKQRGIYK